MKYKRYWAFLLCAFGSVLPVHAAPAVTDLDRAVHTAFMAQQSMLNDNNSLLQMRLQLRSTEKEAVDTLTSAANDAYGALDEAVTLGQILRKMTAVEDQNTVRSYFTTATASFVKTAEADVELIDFSLDKVTTSEARTEATRIRDKITEAINALKPFRTDSSVR